MIAVTVNGEQRNLAQHCTVADALMELGLENQPVLVELNSVALLKSEWTHAHIAAGDSLEIVKIVAGG